MASIRVNAATLRVGQAHASHTHQAKKLVFRKEREVLIQLGVVVTNPNLEEGASRPCCLSESERRCKR